MNCKVCGTRVRDDAAFCHVCGTSLAEQRAEEAARQEAEREAQKRAEQEARRAAMLRAERAAAAKAAEPRPEETAAVSSFEAPDALNTHELSTTHDGMQITIKAPQPGMSPSYAVRPVAPAGFAGPPNPGIPAGMIDSSGVVSQPAPQVLSQRKPRKGIVTLLLCGACLMGAFVFEIVGAVIATLTGADLELFTTGFGALGSCLGIVLLRGKALIKPSLKAIREAWDEGGWWVIATACGLLAFEIADYAMTGGFELASDWPLRVIGCFVLCMFIGIGEESMFRGLLYGGLLDLFGGGRKGLFAAAIVSALLFGAAHVEWWALDYGSLSQVLQALLKIAQTGTYGFFLAAATTRTKSILGPAFIHGLDDFILLLLSVGLMGDSLETEYVSTGEEGFTNVFLYIIVIALYLPLVIQGVRILLNAKLPEQGPFHRS